MEWEEDARQVVEGIPVPETMKNMTILHAEKLARKKKKKKVSMDEVTQTRNDYFELFGETLTKRRRELREKGVSQESIDPLNELNKGPILYQFELCQMRFVGCTRQVADAVDLAKKLKQKLEEWKVTEMIADKCEVPLMPHSRLTISMSGCANSCTHTESKDFGIDGMAIPKFNAEKCTKCGKCADICQDDAILMEEGEPRIIMKHCKQCGACAIFCPQGALVIDKRGYRVRVGGGRGRFHRYAKEVFKMGGEDKVVKALYNSMELFRKEAKGDEHLYHVVERFGLEPIYTDL
jgi:anaerobic sulfite reductase subunit C